MKITICGSIYFAKEMRDAREELEKRGHIVLMPASIDEHNLKSFDCAKKLREDRKHYLKEIKPKYTLNHFKKVKEGDAILVINVEKNNIKNYIGGATFAEIMLAFAEDKKIYFLNPIPEKPETFVDELEAVKPIVLNGNFDLIK